MKDSDYEYQQWQLQGLEAEISRLEEEVASLKEDLADRAWNPVERMPEDIESVFLVTTGGWVVKAKYDVDGGTWREVPLFNALQNVTHWMPLPDPPVI